MPLGCGMLGPGSPDCLTCMSKRSKVGHTPRYGSNCRFLPRCGGWNQTGKLCYIQTRQPGAWKGIYSSIKTWAANLLVVALAGVGLGTNFRTFRGLGIKPFLVGLGAALLVGGVSFIAISLLGSFVTL